MLAPVLAAGAVLSLAAGLRSSPSRLPRELARLSTLDEREIRKTRDRLTPWWVQLFRPVVATVAARLGSRGAGVSADDLTRAGLEGTGIGVTEVLAVKVLSAGVAVCLVAGVALMAPGAAILLPAAGFAGYVTPSVILRRRRRLRRTQMLRELPDLVALLKAFVTAGVPLEQALHLISSQQAKVVPPNLLATEIRKALGDYGLGMSIEGALEAMACRVGLEEAESLAGALAQGKRQGAAMERILRDQEMVVRLAQRNRITAEASRVGTRLVGVLALVYLPEFMVLIMVPLFYGIFLRAFN